MTRPVHALVLGVTLGLLGQTSFATTTELKGQPDLPEHPVLALDVQQKGQPDSPVSVMKSYGVDVPTSSGLRSVVPAGWKTYTHPSITLLDTMSWKLGDRWTDVVAKLATASHGVALIDWSEKAVYIRSAEVALQEGAKQAELLQAATTPLPRFDAPAPRPIAAAVVAAVTPESKVTVANVNPAVAVATATIPVHSSNAPTQLDKPAPVSTAAVPAQASVVLAQAATSQKAETAAQATLAKSLSPSETVVQIPAAEPTTALQPVKSTVPHALSAVVSPASAAIVVGGPVEIQPAHAAESAPAMKAVSMAQAISGAAPVPAPTVLPPVAVAPTVIPAATPAPVGSADFTYSAPVALSKPLARNVAQGIANRYHLRLVWAAPDLRLKGPVTLLGNSADEDVGLLHKALGAYSPVTLEVPAGQGVLFVRDRDGTYPDLAVQHEVALASAPNAVLVGAPMPVASIPASAPVAVKPSAVTLPSTDVATVIVPATVAPAAPVTQAANATPSSTAKQLVIADTAVPLLTLDVHQGEQLYTAIARFAHTQLYTVDWRVAGGFQANRDREFKGKTLADVLRAVLPSLGVSADIDNHTKTIVVRPYDPARDL